MNQMRLSVSKDFCCFHSPLNHASFPPTLCRLRVFQFCVCAEKAVAGEYDNTYTIAAVSSILGFVTICCIFIAVLRVVKEQQRGRQRTAPAPTVHRMNTNTLVATVAEETSITVPTATETGIRRALTADAEMFMPSPSVADSYSNIPIAIAAPATETANLPVTVSQRAEDPANMPVPTARPEAE